jgi:hypothetical protein
MRVNQVIICALLATLSAPGLLQAQTTQVAPATTAAFPVGLGPEGVASDGATVLVANQFSNTVTKLSQSHSMARSSGWRTISAIT